MYTISFNVINVAATVSGSDVIRSALRWWESDLLTGMFSSPQVLFRVYLIQHTLSYVVTVCTGNLLFWCWLWSLAVCKTTYKQPIDTNLKPPPLLEQPFLSSNTHIWLAETDFETIVIFKCLLLSTWPALLVSLVCVFTRLPCVLFWTEVKYETVLNYGWGFSFFLLKQKNLNKPFSLSQALLLCFNVMWPDIHHCVTTPENRTFCWCRLLYCCCSHSLWLQVQSKKIDSGISVLRSSHGVQSFWSSSGQHHLPQQVTDWW